MEKSTLYQAILGIGKRERQHFLQWLEAGIHNQRPELILLCRQLHAFAEQEDPPGSPDKAQIWGKIQPDKPFSDAQMRHQMSYLLRALKQFLAWRAWKKDEPAVDLYLQRALRHYGLYDMAEFKPERKSAAPQLNMSLFSEYQIQLEQWEFRHRSGSTDPAQFAEMTHSFGAFVALSALRHGCAALDKNGMPEASDIDFLPETLAAMAEGRYTDAPAVQIYYHCYLVMSGDSEAHFQQLKALLQAYSAFFQPEAIRDVYMVAINYCIRRLNRGERHFVREALDLYRSGLEQDIMLINGQLPKATYQNILLLALASDEWDWARQFLEDYRRLLAPGERYNAYHFNLALYHFRRKSYGEAQEILRNVEFRDVFYNLDARRMMVRIYFDTGEVMALDSLLNSFRAYLLRHRNIGYHYELNGNFIKYVGRIVQLKPGDKAARQKLRQRIQAEKYVAEREWLLLVTG